MPIGSCARIAISLVLAVCIADAAPKYTRAPSTSRAPEIVDAERLWSVAAALPDRSASEAWEAAATAFIAIVDAGKLPKAEQLDAANAAMLAMKNALSVDPRVKAPSDKTDANDWDRKPSPQPIPAREQKLIRIIESYRKLDATSDDAIGLAFLHANMLRRYEHLDEANVIFLDILDHHRDHETAEYAANLVLDSYNRLQKYDQLVALADRLRADAALMAKFPDLAQTVRRLHAQSVEHEARRCAEQAKLDRARGEQCGDIYLALANEDPRTGDEPLYNAIVTFEAAGRVERVRETARLFVKRHPKSRLRPRVLGHHAMAEAAMGRFSEAAQIGERMVAQALDERFVDDFAEQVVRWRLLLGDLDRASADLEVFAALARGGQRSIVVGLELRLVAARLAAGQRAEAAKLARTVRHLAWDTIGSSSTEVAGLIAAAACPIELVDGLCLRRRDPELMRRVRGELTGVTDPAELELAKQIALDFDLEAVVAHRHGADAERVEAGYRSLVESKSAAMRTAAHARLAQLAHHAKHKDQARVEIEACVRDGRTVPGAESWVRLCGRTRDALRLPALDPIAERLPAAASAIPTTTERLP